MPLQKLIQKRTRLDTNSLTQAKLEITVCFTSTPGGGECVKLFMWRGSLFRRSGDVKTCAIPIAIGGSRAVVGASAHRHHPARGVWRLQLCAYWDESNYAHLTLKFGARATAESLNRRIVKSSRATPRAHS